MKIDKIFQNEKKKKILTIKIVKMAFLFSRPKLISRKILEFLQSVIYDDDKCTVWKFINSSVIQILRETNFG